MTALYSVKTLGATGNGTTNDTLAINAARAAAVVSGLMLAWPPGTYIYDGGTVNDIERWLAPDKMVTLKRSTTSAITALVNVLATEFECEGVTFDGNKANNANPLNLVTVGAANTRSEWRRCTFKNAKASGGYGAGLLILSAVATSVMHRVEDCEFTANDEHGLRIMNAWHVAVARNKCHSNGGNGIFLSNNDPLLAQKVRDVICAENHCHDNGGIGIQVSNFYQDNVAANFAYGPSTPDADHVIIQGNNVRGNGTYGISFQGDKFTMLGNISSGNASGILLNGSRGVVSGNLIVSNTVFGMDAGWARTVTIIGNEFIDNPIALNAGSLNTLIASNQITGSVNVAIYVQSPEGDGSQRSADPAEVVEDRVTILNNYISYPTTKRGVQVVSGESMRVAILNNVFQMPTDTEADARLAIECLGVPTRVHEIEGNKLITQWNRVLTVTAGGVVYIPDVLDSAFLDSPTTVVALQYYDAAIVGTGLAYVTLTNGGTGYHAASTVVTITGDGTGATARANVYEPTGQITGIVVLNRGTGYTTASASISGDGTGATATATAGGISQQRNRKLTLTCLQAQTFNRLGSPNIVDGSGANITVPAGGSLYLIASAAQGVTTWYAK